MKVVKPAATIMLAREKKDGLEILLLKRNKALKFAAGFWVFPGGKIEAADLEQGKNELDTAKIAAARETKEEANISIQPNELIFFSHWTTPVIEPRRYATWFFFGGVSEEASTVKIDDCEIKQHLWISPQAALEKLKTGALAMMPPTFISLQLISKCMTIAEAKAQLSQREPIYILPTLRFQDGKMICLYKGDAGYNDGNINTKGARHRLTTDMKSGVFKFEYNDCDHILPVNMNMHL